MIWGIQVALADDTTAPTTPFIADVGILHDGNNEVLAYASGADGSDQIRDKGGTIDYASEIWWNDGSSEIDASQVRWSLDGDSSVATLSPDGVLTAKGDGTVTVKATVSDDLDPAGGTALVASVVVEITGQSEAPYVTNIQITDEDGNAIDSAYVIDSEDLSATVAQFYAHVTVYDPSDDSTTVYSTANGSLSSQVSGMADIDWYVSDSTFGYIDPDTGMFRPLYYGTLTIFAETNAGESNSLVNATANVTIENSADESDEDDHHADTLDVKVVYEEAPDTIVSEKVFTIDDLYALGTFSQAYTLFRDASGSYYIAVGDGVSFFDLLNAVGVNTEGVSRFEFTTTLNEPNKGISYDYLCHEGYYYRNADVGDFQTKDGPVVPMIAISSNWQRGGTANYDNKSQSQNTRFRLLVGDTYGETQSTSITTKWINGITVILAGGPPVKPDPTPTDPTDNGNGSGNGGGGTGSSTGGAGAGTDDGAGAGGDTDITSNSGSAGGSGGGTGESGTPASASWSIYQMVNPNESDVAQITEDNPFAPYAGPVAGGVVAAGATQSAASYRLQKRGQRKSGNKGTA